VKCDGTISELKKRILLAIIGGPGAPDTKKRAKRTLARGMLRHTVSQRSRAVHGHKSKSRAASFYIMPGGLSSRDRRGTNGGFGLAHGLL